MRKSVVSTFTYPGSLLLNVPIVVHLSMCLNFSCFDLLFIYTQLVRNLIQQLDLCQCALRLQSLVYDLLYDGWIFLPSTLFLLICLLDLFLSYPAPSPLPTMHYKQSSSITINTYQTIPMLKFSYEGSCMTFD